MAARGRRPSLTDAVLESVAAMEWLAPTDQAAVELAVRQAKVIDAASPDDRASITRMVGAHLLDTLRCLGGTPAERRSLGAKEVTGGRLGELRAARGHRDPAPGERTAS